MSDASVLIEPMPDSTVRPPVQAASLSGASAAALLWRLLIGLLAVVALVALIVSLALWQRVSGMQEQLARQSADALAQSLEARTLARQAQEIVRDTAGRLALVETRVGEVALQRSQLEELMQSLSRSRDENLVVDIEAAIRSALQQAQVTGNVQPLLAALKAGDLRIDRAGQPRLAPLQRAMQHDADRLRASANADAGDTLRRIDDLIRSVDDLPVVNAVSAGGKGVNSLQSEPLPPGAPWWRRFLLLVQNEARSLLRVGRVDRPEAVLLTPDQTFFLRENLKLKLLNARLSVLSRQVETARGELASVSTSINRYFDPASRRVQAAATMLQEIQGQLKTSEPPRVDETLAALATAAAGR